MVEFKSLLEPGNPLIVPGAHDALTARLIEVAGFTAYGIGGSALAATQLALPDVGLQSFGEYRDAIGRIMEGTDLPVLVDGENGFGDAKAITRTVRAFDRLRITAVAFEDLAFPPVLGRPATLISRDEMSCKLRAAVKARGTSQLAIIARTDAAHVVGVDEAISRATGFQALGADAVLCTGLPDAQAYARLRSAVSIPIVAVVVPGSPWFAPTTDELVRLGVDCAMYPAAVLPRIVAAIREGLDAIRCGVAPTSPTSLAEVLRTTEWTEIDRHHSPGSGS